MKTTFISLIALGVAVAMAGPADRALAGEPMVLTDAQLDRVTAGMNKNELIAKVAADSNLSRRGEVEIRFAVPDRALENPNFLRGFLSEGDRNYVKTVPGGRP